MKKYLFLLFVLFLAVDSMIAEDNKNTSSKNNYNTIKLTPQYPKSRPLSPSNQTVEVYQTGDILTFGITEEMGACIIFIGERENPVETYVISCDHPCVSVSGIEAGEYPLILVTEGYQIFQGTIEL